MRSLKARFWVSSVVFAITFSSCGPSQQSPNTSISVKGSDTMLLIVAAWADSFMKRHPGTQISVTGGGSGTGISALLNGTTDICSASREMTPDELKLAQQKSLQIHETPVARDGIALIVNPKNTIAELTTEQIRNIYTGTFSNWQQVGGAPANVVVLSRESSSGTYLFFLEHVLEKHDYRPDAMLLPTTSAIIQSVADSPAAIGYVGLGYALEAKEKVKLLGVKPSPDAAAVIPNEDTVRSGSYSIARKLYFYTSGDAAGTKKDFLDFCISSEGQAIVKANGYIAVN